MAESNDVKTVFFKKAKETSIVRKPWLLREAAIHDNGNEGVVTAPRQVDKPILTRFGMIPPSETTKSINTERIVRRARKHISDTPGADRPVVVDGDSIPQKSTAAQERIRFEVPAKAPCAGDENTESLPEDKTIDVTSLRRFAVRMLPKESILREIILLEEKELTTEQFLSKLPIWLRLLNHEN